MKNAIIFLITLSFGLSLQAQKIIEEEIICLSDTIRLAGTLSYPKDAAQLPTAIIVSGTGKQDRDGTFAKHKPFKEIASYLNNLGYAVLRVDDRGTGQSTGVYEDATTRDFAKDVKAELEFLKSRPQIDPKRIGIIGHSEGGTIAFMVAAQRKDVAFLVSLAGASLDGYTGWLLQNRALLSSNPQLSEKVVDDYMNMYTVLFDVLKNTPLNEDVETLLDEAFEQWYANQDKETLEGIGFIEGRNNYFMSRFKYTALRRWYREMMQLQPSEYLSRITIPMLVLNGDKDLLVTPDENLEVIKNCLDKAGNTQYKIVRIPDHNHMFQHCKECTQVEITKLPEAISEETLTIIGEWLLQLK